MLRRQRVLDGLTNGRLLRRMCVAVAIGAAASLPLWFTGSEASASPVIPVTPAAADAASPVIPVAADAQGCVCGCIWTGGLIDLCICFGEVEFYYLCNIGCDDPCIE